MRAVVVGLATVMLWAVGGAAVAYVSTHGYGDGSGIALALRPTSDDNRSEPSGLVVPDTTSAPTSTTGDVPTATTPSSVSEASSDTPEIQTEPLMIQLQNPFDPQRVCPSWAALDPPQPSAPPLVTAYPTKRVIVELKEPTNTAQTTSSLSGALVMATPDAGDCEVVTSPVVLGIAEQIPAEVILDGLGRRAALEVSSDGLTLTLTIEPGTSPIPSTSSLDPVSGTADSGSASETASSDPTTASADGSPRT
jgi:hypothetical protein